MLFQYGELVLNRLNAEVSICTALNSAKSLLKLSISRRFLSKKVSRNTRSGGSISQSYNVGLSLLRSGILSLCETELMKYYSVSRTANLAENL